MRIEPLGDSALLVRVVDDYTRDSEAALQAVLGALRQLEAASLPGVVELAPAYATVAVFFSPASSYESLKREVEATLANPSDANAGSGKISTVDVPVCYEREFGPDLREVARHTGLPVEEVVHRHSSVTYRVSCVGFTPGFPYLSGLPGTLATPRRDSPRTRIPAGSVAIGGTQTGIYPSVSPGGWNLIGRTPLRLFDASRERPALFQAGDRVRFHRISRDEFEQSSA